MGYNKTAINFSLKNGIAGAGDSLLNGFKGVKAGFAAAAEGARFKPLKGEEGAAGASAAFEAYFGPLGIDHKKFVMSRQTHSDLIYEARAPGFNCFTGKGPLAEPDAIITKEKNIPLGVFTADCCPLLMYVPDKAAACVHAGWQGAFLNITGKTVKKLKAICGTGPENIYVSVGPAVCGRCYEVGEEILEAFMKRYPDIDGAYDTPHRTLDIRRVILSQLEEERIPQGNISVTGLCTKETLYLPSYRRDGSGADRMISYIMME